MATQDKTVKITIVVDPQSAALAKRQIVEIKDQVDALVKSVQSLGSFLGGAGGLKMGQQAGQPGTSSATQAMHGGAGGGGGLGGVQSMLTVGAAGGATNLKKFAEAHKEYTKSVKADLSSLTAAANAEVGRQTSIWAKFKAMISGKGGAGGGGGGGAGGGGGGGNGIMGGARGGFMQNAAQALGVPSWAVGAAGVGGAVIGAGMALWSAASAQQGAKLQYEADSPMYGSRLAAQGGGMFGGNTVAIRHGDLARSWAIDQVKVDRDFSKDYAKVNSAEFAKNVIARVERESPTSWGQAIKAGPGAMGKLAMSNLGNIWNDGVELFSHPINNLKRHFTNGIGGLVSADGGGGVPGEPSAAFVARQNSIVNHAMDQPKRRQEIVENYIASHPVFGNQLNEFYNNSLGDLGLSRSAGISGAFVKRKDGTYGDSVADFKAKADLLHVGAGELAGYQQQMGAAAGRGFFYNGGSLISPQAGGLSNAAQIFGVGAQFNGGGQWGGAAGFMKGIQGQIGRGGVDVTAGSQIAGIGMGAMTSGNFGAMGGGGFMAEMMEAASGGSTGRDMRGARGVARGLAGMGQVMSGSLDPLQKALNYSAAMQVGGDLPWQTQQALANMDPATMMEVMRNPNSAQANSLKSKGLTADLMRKYMSASGQSTFSRIVADTLTDRGKQALASYQSSGGNTKYMQGLVNNLTAAKHTKGSKKKRERAVSDATSALDQAESDLASLYELDRGWDTETALYNVRLQMSREGLFPKLKGHGAHRSDTTKSNRGQIQKVKAGITKQVGNELAEKEAHGKVISTAVGNVKGNADTEDKLGQAAAHAGATAGGDLNATIGQLDGILRKFVGQVHELAGGGGDSGPPGE